MNMYCLKLYVQQMQEVRMLYPIALRKAKIVSNFGLSECNRVKFPGLQIQRSKGYLRDNCPYFIYKIIFCDPH